MRLGDDLHQGDAGTVQVDKAELSGCWSCRLLPASCSRCSRSMPTRMAFAVLEVDE